MNHSAFSRLLAFTLTSIVAATILLFSTVARSQDLKWMNFTSGSYVNAIADDGDLL